MAALLLLAVCPLLAHARLGSGIMDLTISDFDSFLQKNDKVMVDFVDGKDDQSSNLTTALRMIRNYGSKVPVARVDANKYPDLATRYFRLGCSDETKECGERLPQLLWFLHGQPTQYHRMLREPSNIANFVLGLDRDPIKTTDEADVANWNQVVILRSKRNAQLYKTAEVVATRHMDGAAFIHIETSGIESVSWAINGTVKEVFSLEFTVDKIDEWVRQKLTLSEDAPEIAQDDDGSIIVVGKTFEELVLRDDADVMMIVYAPWCGFSRKAMPEWKKLATMFKGVAGAPMVAKMDGTLNRSPLSDLHWTSFPKIIYMKKGEKHPILFENEERTAQAFLEFAKNHTTSPIGLASDDIMMMQESSLREL